jgi:hypothetical protein
VRYANTYPDTNANTDPDTNANTDPDTNANTDPDTNANADSNPNSHTDTHPNPGLPTVDSGRRLCHRDEGDQPRCLLSVQGRRLVLVELRCV